MKSFKQMNQKGYSEIALGVVLIALTVLATFASIRILGNRAEEAEQAQEQTQEERVSDQGVDSQPENQEEEDQIENPNSTGEENDSPTSGEALGESTVNSNSESGPVEVVEETTEVTVTQGAGSSEADGQTLNISDFRYPSSSEESSTSTSLDLRSNDSAQNITNWYEEKLEELGLSTNSFVETDNNGQIENKLSAAGGSKEVNVTILKEKDEETVTIRVDLSS